MIDNQQTGKNLMILRVQKGLSQQGLAELCNVTHQAVSKWENGAALPDMQTLLFLSKYYGVAMEDILTEEISLDAKEEPAPPAESALPAVPEEPTVPMDPPEVRGGVPKMSWEQIVELAPFARSETLKALADRCTEALDEERLCDLAPFLSAKYLDKLARRLTQVNPGLVFKLAPFLSSETMDWLILGGQDQQAGEEN